MPTDTDPAAEAMLARLRDEFHGGDDAGLWALAVERVTADVDRLFAAAVSPPRHVVLAFARVRRKRAGLHPDEHATLRLAWERDRGDAEWRFAGPHPRVRRHRGSYVATACVPAGTVRLAFVDVVVLWRPRLPWAEPADTEIGRQIYPFRRDPAGAWRAAGVKDR